MLRSRHSIKTIKQAGFTLIELMIVVAIIGILAAVAVPAFQDYMARSKITEVISAMSACRTGVTEFATSQNRLPASADEGGCASGAQSKYVANMAVGAGGVITATVRNINKVVDTKTVSFTPTRDTDGTAKTPAKDGETITGWACSSSFATGDFKFLPSNCRQSKVGTLN